MSLFVSPIPRRHELASPDPAMGGLCSLFLTHISFGIPTIGERPSLLHHLRAKIIAAGKTDSEYPPVGIKIPLLAAHDLAADEIGKSERCQMAAEIGLSVRRACL